MQNSSHLFLHMKSLIPTGATEQSIRQSFVFGLMSVLLNQSKQSSADEDEVIAMMAVIRRSLVSIGGSSLEDKGIVELLNGIVELLLNEKSRLEVQNHNLGVKESVFR